MSPRPLLIVVLAAGKGTRMKSALPKVLHNIAGRSMLAHVLALARERRPAALAVVIGPGMEDVRAEALREAPTARGVRASRAQGHGGRGARSTRSAGAAQGRRARALRRHAAASTTDTLRRLIGALDRGAGIAVLGFEAADPTGYGRLLTRRAAARSTAIREEQGRERERAPHPPLQLGRHGLPRCTTCSELLGRIGNANAKGEYYLTDAVAIARQQAARARRSSCCAEEEVLGVNSRDQLAAAEGDLPDARSRCSAMREGVTLIAPETVWLSLRHARSAAT